MPLGVAWSRDPDFARGGRACSALAVSSRVVDNAVWLTLCVLEFREVDGANGGVSRS